MIKNLRPVDGSEQRERQGGSWVRAPLIQGKPCLSVLITAPAACVAFSLRLHVAIRSNSVVEDEHLWHLIQPLDMLFL